MVQPGVSMHMELFSKNDWEVGNEWSLYVKGPGIAYEIGIYM